MKTSYVLNRAAYNAKLELRCADWVEPNPVLGVPFAGREARVTYWLYFNGWPVASVRGKMGLSDDSVRGVARMDFERNPTLYAGFPEIAPYQHRHHIAHAEVRVFFGGN